MNLSAYFSHIVPMTFLILFKCFSSKVFRSKGQSPESFFEKIGSFEIKPIINKETINALETKLKSSSQNVTQLYHQLHKFYIPLYYYVSHKRKSYFDKLNEATQQEKNKKKTFFIGISAPQVI